MCLTYVLEAAAKPSCTEYGDMAAADPAYQVRKIALLDAKSQGFAGWTSNQDETVNPSFTTDQAAAQGLLSTALKTLAGQVPEFFSRY